MTWMTPLVAGISAWMTVALPTITLPSAALMALFPVHGPGARELRDVGRSDPGGTTW